MAENPMVVQAFALTDPGDAGVKIAAAIAMLPAGVGGFVDATGFTNPQNLTGFTIPPGVTVSLGPVLFTLPTASPSITVNQGGRLLGSGRNSPGSTTLKAYNGFNKDIVKCISTSGEGSWWHHGDVANLRIDGNKANNTVGNGVSVYGVGETSMIAQLSIFNCAQAGLYIKGSNSGTGNIENVTVNTCGIYGVQLDGFCSGLTLKCVGGDSNPTTFAITNPRLGGGSLLLIDPKSEAAPGLGSLPDPVLLVTGGNSKVTITILGGNFLTGDTGRTAIRFSADSVVNHAVSIMGLSAAGQTIVIDDLRNRVQVMSPQVCYYQDFKYCAGHYMRFDENGLVVVYP